MHEDISRYGHSTNLLGIPTCVLASHWFNVRPLPLHISGTREAAPGLFDQLAHQDCAQACGQMFQDYMCVVFGFDTEQRLKEDATGRRRYKSSYLRLIQDWGIDSNNAQAAVLKGWVESRFGLFPNFHRQRITSFNSEAWWTYVEDKMNSRFHNNCIYMQLDLLYEFCQFLIAKFGIPAPHHKTLYRGVNTLDEWLVVSDRMLAEQHSSEIVDSKIYRFNSIVSFTDNPSIADEFGRYVLEVEVPMVKLLFFSDLLPQHALRGEAEYLVIGGDYRIKVLK